MKLELPKEPVDLYEFVCFVIVNNKIKKLKFVYHTDAKWSDFFPGKGSDLHDEWSFFEDDNLESRYIGWDTVLKRSWDSAFATLEEAKVGLVENIEAQIEEAGRKIFFLKTLLKEVPHQCEFTCQGCGKRASGVYGRDFAWHKPSSWFERSDDDGVQTVCSRECIELVAKKTGKTGVVLPI